MRVPGVGHLLRWRYARPVLQAPLLILSVLMILHGFIKKTQKTPLKDLTIAKKRLREIQNEKKTDI